MSRRLIALTLATLILVPALAKHDAAAPHLENRSTCSLTGNPDLYGLGIRLGVYFQWLSALITSRLTSANFAGLIKSYVVFLGAIFIAILVLTRTQDSVRTEEMLILLYIFFGGDLVFSPIQPRRGAKVTLSPGFFLGVLLMVGGMGIYSAWFWFAGRNGGFVVREACTSYGFLFAKVDLGRPVVAHAFAAFSVLWTAYIVACVGMYIRMLRMLIAIRGERTVWSVVWTYLVLKPTWDALVGGVNYGMRSWIVFAIKAFSFVYSVLGIELTLAWNRISDVYTIRSIGQLIPFVIGLSVLLQSIYERIKERTPENDYADCGAQVDLKMANLQNADGTWSV